MKNVFPNTIGGWISSIVGLLVILGAISTSYLHFQTDAEASETREDIERSAAIVHETLHDEFIEYQLQQAFKEEMQLKQAFRSEKSKLEKEISDIDYKLLYDSLTEPQKEFWRNRRKDLKHNIECIETNGCDTNP